VGDFRAQPPAVTTAPAVPTELPTSQALNAAANIPELRNDSRKADQAAAATTATGREIIDPQTSVVVFQSVNAQGRVVEQVPTQALLRRRAYEEAQTVQALVKGKDVTAAVLGAVENVDTTT
jgi:nitrogen fixation protein FixH